MSTSLEDELAIRRVLATYAKAIDQRDYEKIASCYFEDAQEDRGRFKGSIPEFISWLKRTLDGFDSCWHLLGEPWIALDGDLATAETPCLGHHRLRNPTPGEAADHLIPCRYVDRFERRGGEWRIVSRRAIYEPVLAITVNR